MSDSSPAEIEGFGVARLSALTDGVFAVVLTLLVIDLRPPQAATNGMLFKELREIAPSLLEFVITFSIVSIFWYGHHMESHWIRRVDRMHLMITLMLLLTICFLPFTETLLERNDQLPLALTIYGANLGLAGVCRLLHWTHATRGKRLVDEDMDAELIRRVSRVFMLVVILYIAGIAISWISTIAALICFALTPLLYVRPSRQTRHLTSLPRRQERAS